MFSLNSHLAQTDPLMLHSFVDSFFIRQKTLVKDRLRQAMEPIVDGLFEEMVEQVKEMLLPPKSVDNDQVKVYDVCTPTPAKPPTTKSPMNTQPVPSFQPPKSKMVFATKSKPGPSSSSSVPLSQPFSGLYKRMAEGDGGNNSTQPNKKKAIPVELQIDGPLDDDEEDDYGDSTFDEGAGGGGIEQMDKDTAHENIANNPKQQQPKQTAEKKVACPEPGCGKLMHSRHLKRHLRKHTGVKPYFCNFPLCEMECATRQHAIRHIVSIHHRDYIEDGLEPPDPETWLVIREHLL